MTPDQTIDDRRMAAILKKCQTCPRWFYFSDPAETVCFGDQCDRCHGVYSDEFGVECACEPEYEHEESGPEDWCQE